MLIKTFTTIKYVWINILEKNMKKMKQLEVEGNFQKKNNILKKQSRKRNLRKFVNQLNTYFQTIYTLKVKIIAPGKNGKQ